MSLEILEKLENGRMCIFCRHNDLDELRYGKVYKFGTIITHYFCMLFSSNMEQNGADEEGILGFMPKDIEKEVARGSKLVCHYCRHPGATIGCFIKSCKKKFHFPCGIQHGSLHLFYGQFRSYCYFHRRNQVIPQYAIKLTEKPICVMCQDEVTAKPTLYTVWAPCCKTAWLHRKCVQKMAINAGYFFKCPNCNNKEIFRAEMLDCGIYIPDQDAAWELEPNAFNELTERYSSCDAEKCVCPKGRNHSDQAFEWEIVLCNFCGSQGIHNKCGEHLFDSNDQWTCLLCQPVTGTEIVSSVEKEPGPSVSTKETQSLPSKNLRKDPNFGSDSRNRRKRNLSTSFEQDPDSPPSKQRTETSDQDVSLVLNNSGESIPVMHLSKREGIPLETGGVNSENIVELDSDSDDNDSTNKINDLRVEKSSNSVCDSDIEKKLINLGIANIDQINKSTTTDHDSSIVIDLLDDSDDETQKCKFPIFNSKGKDDDDEDDDVIFVSCDSPKPQTSKENTGTALIRIVNNNGILLTTPKDLKKNGNLDTLNSNYTTMATKVVNPTQTTLNILPNNNVNGNSNNQTFVWQSVPLHKSIIHTYQTPQIISTMSLSNNDSSINPFIDKGKCENGNNNDKNSHVKEILQSEIIDLDD